MRRTAICGLFAIMAVLGGEGRSIAAVKASPHDAIILFPITGAGAIRLDAGFGTQMPFYMRCKDLCPPDPMRGLTVVAGDQVKVTAVPASGWKFSAWRGVCSGSKPTCVVRLNHSGNIGAIFVPTTPGLARSLPLPLGKTATIGYGWRLRVLSVTPNAKLDLPTPPGAQDFVALIRATYIGGGSDDTGPLYANLKVMGAHNATYGAGCGGATVPSPDFGYTGHQVFSGQSFTGNVCWQIARNDASSLELFASDFPNSIWFALH
jgi:hypothetical protein